MKYLPEEDGLTHINIYSKGKTTLGRLLSNFACTPFEHPVDGRFASIEGYWFWKQLQLWCEKDSCPTIEELNELRILWGYKAKKYGKELCAKYFKGGAITLEQDKEFKEQIKKAIYAKVASSKSLQGMIEVSELPFSHYYSFYGKLLEPTAHKWQVLFWEEIRSKLKEKTLF